MKKPLLILLLCCSFHLAFTQWTNVSTGKTSQILLCQALDANTCIAPGNYGKIFVTRDGGMTFDSVQTVFIYDIFGALEFVNDSVGFLAGGSWFGTHHCFLLKTTDRGQSWDSITSEVGSGYYAGNICFLDDQTGFMATDEGLIYKTTDGGQNFSPLTLTGTSNLEISDIDFPDNQAGYVSSWEAISSSVFLYRIDKTTDLGQTWTAAWRDTLYGQTVANDRRISSLHFLSPAEGFAGGTNGRLLHTTDGGQSWNLAVLATDSSNLRQILFTDPLHGYIASTLAYGGPARPFFYTSDGGQSWQRQNFSGFPMSMIGPAGYAVGNDLALYATQSGGLHATASQPGLRLEAFPNPVGDRLTVRTSPSLAGSTLTITDMSGKVLRRETLRQPEQTIDIHGLAFGTYLLSLDHPTQGRISKKFAVVGH
jgi:photosystem II stability/assembly factor-like uncharacterized protein